MSEAHKHTFTVYKGGGFVKALTETPLYLSRVMCTMCIVGYKIPKKKVKKDSNVDSCCATGFL